jgi:hypothetical protein
LKWCWISASIEIFKWFLSLFLLMCCITFIVLHMLNHPYIPGMKPTWSYIILAIWAFWYVIEFSLPLFYREIGL